jgi:hypothetical protein
MYLQKGRKIDHMLRKGFVLSCLVFIYLNIANAQITRVFDCTGGVSAFLCEDSTGRTFSLSLRNLDASDRPDEKFVLSEVSSSEWFFQRSIQGESIRLRLVGLPQFSQIRRFSVWDCDLNSSKTDAKCNKGSLVVKFAKCIFGIGGCEIYGFPSWVIPPSVSCHAHFWGAYVISGDLMNNFEIGDKFYPIIDFSGQSLIVSLKTGPEISLRVANGSRISQILQNSWYGSNLAAQNIYVLTPLPMNK